MALIRPGQRDDLPFLPEIENQAALRLLSVNLTGLHTLFSAHVTAAEAFEAYLRAGLLWVAVEDERPVGFIVVSIIGNCVHIDEVDVLPDYGRRGIGTALIETVCSWAVSEGLTGATLSTQSNIRWNQPYYEKLGFRIMPPDAWTPAYQEIRSKEAKLGFPMQDRVLMKRIF